MPTSLTACQQSPEFYLAPENYDGETLHYAATRCHACPVLKDCARDALHAGDSLDGHRHRPATDVIQAGIICKGDQDTAQALAKIAGVSAPRYRDKQTRAVPASECVECGTPMTRWTRGEVPEGSVMHHARGFCINCRHAYTTFVARLKEEAPREVRTTRPIDRRRHHDITTWRHPVTGDRGSVTRPRRAHCEASGQETGLGQSDQHLCG